MSSQEDIQRALQVMLDACREDRLKKDEGGVLEEVLAHAARLTTPAPPTSSAPSIQQKQQAASSDIAQAPAPAANVFNLGSFLQCDWSDDSSEDESAPQRDPTPIPDAPETLPDDRACEREPVAEEVMLQSMELLGRAQTAWGAGQHFKAQAYLSTAIEGNPSQSLLYAARGAYYLKLRRPKSALQDANLALTYNPESARGHKVKGKAYALLKKWDSALHHLRIGNQLLYDEKSYTQLKKAEAKCKERRMEELARGSTT